MMDQLIAFNKPSKNVRTDKTMEYLISRTKHANSFAWSRIDASVTLQTIRRVRVWLRRKNGKCVRHTLCQKRFMCVVRL